MLLLPVFWRRAALRGALGVVVAWLALVGAVDTAQAQAAAPATPLPPEIEAALARARLPREALSVMVVDAQGGKTSPARLAHRAQLPVNPASVMKLVTTYAALEQLGPAYVWNTPVYLQGAVQDGSLRGQGIQVMVGDIVLARTAFELPAHDPGRFDGEPLRPYNAAPDALLLNYKSSVMTFVPDAAAGLARIQYDPPLAGVARQATVALGAPGTECGDWRCALRAELADPAKVSFQGVYPAACGERVWPVARADPRGFAARAVEGMWRELGGKLRGSVREGKVPPGLKPAFTVTSPALSEVVRDVNKYSNNVMAQQVFLTLALQKNGVATFDGARDALRQWWLARIGDAELPQADNGAGLSRDARLTAQALARMLQVAWVSPVMPELVASLPISGVDGTLRRSQSRAGTAHLKTGSLRDVMAVAGYVHAASGWRYVLVAVVNHANAGAARPVLDSLIDWTARDQ